MTEEIFQIKNEDVKSISKEILNLGYSMRGMARVGIDLRSSIYKGCSYRCQSTDMKRLETILGHSIPAIKLPMKKDVPIRSRDRDLAEMIGIMLGDGCIFRYRDNVSRISITLNSLTEREYISHVNKLMIKIFGNEPAISYRKNANAAVLTLYGERYIRFLEVHGMKSGKKTIINPYVPDWIKIDDDLIKSCLRGLVDTDGCVYVQNDEVRGIHRICINFSNRSRPLLEDFRNMCNKIGVNTNKIGKCGVNILSMKDVKHFIDLVHPMKYEALILSCPQSTSLLDPIIDTKNDGSRYLYDRYTIEMLREIAKKRGGTMLSDVYEGCDKKLIWQCNKGHTWRTTALNVVRKGTWCARCSGMKSARNLVHEVKFVISKEDLEKIVWEMPSERIAEKYGVSGSAIVKRCKQLGIEKPGRGYWARQRAKERSVPIPPGDTSPAMHVVTPTTTRQATLF
jgi:hypothetical protein